MTTQPPPPDDPSSIPDEVWEKFRQDTESAIRQSAPKEPSARARMVARKLREQDELAAVRKPRQHLSRAGRARRAGRKDHARREPEGWRTGPARQEMREQESSPLRRWIRSVLIAAGVGAIAVFALNPSGAKSLLHDRNNDSSATATATAAPQTATPTPAAGGPAANH